MVWPTLGSRMAKERNRTSEVMFDPQNYKLVTILLLEKVVKLQYAHDFIMV